MQVETEKITILRVDDNATNLLALETILEAPDRNLVKASSGDEAPSRSATPISAETCTVRPGRW